jgi:hypothetical protein
MRTPWPELQKKNARIRVLRWLRLWLDRFLFAFAESQRALSNCSSNRIQRRSGDFKRSKQQNGEGKTPKSASPFFPHEFSLLFSSHLIASLSPSSFSLLFFLSSLSFSPSQERCIDPPAASAPWFQPAESNASAEAVLDRLPDGRFLIHNAESGLGFVVSYRYNGRTYHRDLLVSGRGLYFEDSFRSFATLSEFVAHCCRADMAEDADMPCRLVVPGSRRRALPEPLARGSPGSRRSLDPRMSWDVTDVCRWLAESGFASWNTEFAARGVTGPTLIGLTAADLERMGLGPEDERQRFHKLLAEMTIRVTEPAALERPGYTDIVFDDSPAPPATAPATQPAAKSIYAVVTRYLHNVVNCKCRVFSSISLSLLAFHPSPRRKSEGVGKRGQEELYEQISDLKSPSLHGSLDEVKKKKRKKKKTDF